MKIATPLLIPLMTAIAACGGSGSTNSDQSPADAGSANQVMSTTFADSQIATLVYDNTYSVPDGFFVDERSDTSRSYTVHHVLDNSSSYELCTDDYAVALTWEEVDNKSRSVQGYYVTSYDNARYFEFVRELSYEDDVGNINDLTSPGFARVFKCSNTNRDGVDRSLLNGYAGVLNAHPLTTESVRVFAEYLWQFTFFPTSRKKVIDSVNTQTNTELKQTLLLAFSTTQGVDRCDLIEVAEWQFSADRDSGEITKSFEIIRSFEAKPVNGIAELCD